MENVTGVFVTFLTATLPLAVLTERITVGLRLLVERGASTPTGDVPKAGNPLWIVVPFVIGLGLCLGWQYNFIAPLAKSIPALANSTRFDGIAGQVLTGLFVGALAGPFHEKINEWNSRRKANEAVAATSTTEVVVEDTTVR